MKDIAVRLQNRPGTLAAAAAALDGAGIAVTGACGFAIAGQGLRHLLVADGQYEAVLHQAGAELVEERDVLVLEIDPRPGWLTDITSRLGEAGVNIELIYLAVDNRLVIGPSDMEKAKRALSI